MPRTPLLRRIDQYVKRTGVSATRLGREAANDPGIVFDLRAGRKLRAELEQRLAVWLDARQAGKESRPCSRW
jgi:hypothetical protein